MHVQDAPAIARDDVRGHELEKAGQHEELDPMALERLQPLPGRRMVAECHGGDPTSGGQGERGRVGAIAQHEDHARRRIRSQRPEQRLEIAAAPGDGYGHVHRHGGRR